MTIILGIAVILEDCPCFNDFFPGLILRRTLG